MRRRDFMGLVGSAIVSTALAFGIRLRLALSVAQLLKATDALLAGGRWSLTYAGLGPSWEG
jgi:NhaP-type Na+/H+ or K+/H+ antiporter